MRFSGVAYWVQLGADLKKFERPVLQGGRRRLCTGNPSTVCSLIAFCCADKERCAGATMLLRCVSAAA
jgi:hypothetical protein